MRLGSTSDRQRRDIACDESGYEGERLVGGETDGFARAAVFVTHGGMNSMMEGLANKVPLVVLPQQVQQLIIGSAVAERGPRSCCGTTCPAALCRPPSCARPSTVL